MVANVEMMAYAGETPWHTIGTKVSEDILSKDMLTQSSLDWTVEQWPIQAIGENGTFANIGDLQANMRIFPDGSNSYLGSVGAYTHPLQNSDVFAALDPFVENGLAKWETAGSLDSGRKVWAMLRIVGGDNEIRPNDYVASYATITNYHDGKGSVRVGFTPIRIVCANTMVLAHNDKASKLIRINHSKHVKTRVDDIVSTMDVVKNEFAMSSEKYRYLASRKSINSSDLEKFTRIVFGIDEDTPKMQLTASQRDRIAVTQELFEFGRGNLGESWYDAYNAVTEYLSHVAGRSVETRYDSLWYGHAMNISQKALDTAFALAG